MASGTHGKRDAFGSVLGIFTFLGGIALLLLTFRMSYDMFSTPPKDALGIGNAKVLDPGLVGNSLSAIIIKILLLLVMGVMASLIANRGITLYSHSRGLPGPKEKVSSEPRP